MIHYIGNGLYENDYGVIIHINQNRDFEDEFGRLDDSDGNP